MQNAILTSKVITKEALRVLHNEVVMVGLVRRDFDASFAQAGAKIGSTLRIRKPAQFGLRKGQQLQVQSFVETETTLTLSEQLGIDVEMTSAELTLDLNTFSEQVLKPQISRLAAGVEEFLMPVISSVGNFVFAGTAGNKIQFADMMASVTGLDKQTTPRDKGGRAFVVSPDHMAGYMDSVKGLFNPNSTIGDQYDEGQMLDSYGYKVKASNLIPNYPIIPSADGTLGGTAIAITGITLGGANETGGFTIATLTFSATTGASVLRDGTIFTINNCFQVNPETKKVYGNLQGFAVTGDYVIGSGATSVVVTLGFPVYVSGPLQNVSTTPAGAGSFIGSTSKELVQSIAFHREAFTLGCADLVLPSGVDMAARETGDGISMRLIRQYNAQTDQFPSRLDVIVGRRALRQEYAQRIIGGVA